MTLTVKWTNYSISYSRNSIIDMATSWINLTWSVELFDINVIYKAVWSLDGLIFRFLSPFLLDSLNLLIFKEWIISVLLSEFLNFFLLIRLQFYWNNMIGVSVLFGKYYVNDVTYVKGFECVLILRTWALVPLMALNIKS